MKSDTENQIKEILLDLVGETIQPALQNIPFKNVKDVRKALQFLAEEIESLDANEIFANLEVDPDEFVDEEEYESDEEEE